MLRLDMGVGVGLLVRLVCAVEEGAPKHWLLTAFVGHVSSISAFVPVFPFALFTFVGHIIMSPKVFCLHWHYWKHVLHHVFKEVYVTCNKINGVLHKPIYFTGRVSTCLLGSSFAHLTLLAL